MDGQGFFLSFRLLMVLSHLLLIAKWDVQNEKITKISEIFLILDCKKFKIVLTKLLSVKNTKYSIKHSSNLHILFVYHIGSTWQISGLKNIHLNFPCGRCKYSWGWWPPAVANLHRSQSRLGVHSLQLPHLSLTLV